jgi:aminoglycoside phosphotransferase (APT) family kinase protein
LWSSTSNSPAPLSGICRFYYAYAGLRQAIILSRITRRRIHFGEQEAPVSPDEYVLHHEMLARLIAD